VYRRNGKKEKRLIKKRGLASVQKWCNIAAYTHHLFEGQKREQNQYFIHAAQLRMDKFAD